MSGAAERGRDLFRHGVPGKVEACRNCHGDHGEGGGGGRVPRLAGLPAQYLTDQLRAFQRRRRQGGPMVRIAASMSEAQIARVAAFAATLPLRRDARASRGHAAAARAARLVVRGDWSRKLPACADCHGPRLMGGGPSIPPLVGQGAAYVAAQLRAYRQGTRPAGPLHLMGDVARRLKDTEIEPLARSLAALAPGERPAVAGEARSPWPPVPRSPDSFVPPPETAMPTKGPYAALLHLGEKIFDDTPRYAAHYAGNRLSCRNCHLDRGRLASAMPLWAAVPHYPRYRAKSRRVVTLSMRIQGCFRFSENGRVPPPDAEEVVALTTYLHWLATGLPVGLPVPAEGMPKPAPPSSPPDRARGRRVYRRHCALCHGQHGQGRIVSGDQVFPPLWGPQSFNWGAGMHRIDKAAAFIKANMPFSRGNSLTDQQAWDVAAYMDTQPRPQDPRFNGSVGETRRRYHAASPYDAYGRRVDGRRLGAPATTTHGANDPNASLPNEDTHHSGGFGQIITNDTK